MTDQHAPFSFGIEEEYLLVDLATRDLAPEAPKEMLAACEKKLGKLFSREYISSQIEIGTPVCNTPSEARRSLLRCGTETAGRCRSAICHGCSFNHADSTRTCRTFAQPFGLQGSYDEPGGQQHGGRLGKEEPKTFHDKSRNSIVKQVRLSDLLMRHALVLLQPVRVHARPAGNWQIARCELLVYWMS